METNEKILLLKTKFSEFNKFKDNLNAENLEEFESLRLGILELLDENQKIRFNRINFYSQKATLVDFDDVPF